MRLDSLQSELSKVEARRARLQAQIEKEATAIYTGLPRKVGLKSVDELVQALLPYTSTGLRNKLGGSTGSTSVSTPSPRTPANQEKSTPASTGSAKTKSASKRGRLSQYSDALKAKVREAFDKGVPAKQIEKELGVKVFTLKKWKQKWGMTKGPKGRSSAATKPAAKAK